MLHKSLQRDVVRKDSLRVLSEAAVGARRVSRRWIQLGEQETCLRAPGVAHNKSRQGKSVLNQFLRRAKSRQYRNARGNEWR